MIRCFRRTVAIPAPALYAQFDETHSVDRVLSGLLKLGFDEVFEVAEAVSTSLRGRYHRGLREGILGSLPSSYLERLSQLSASSSCFPS